MTRCQLGRPRCSADEARSRPHRPDDGERREDLGAIHLRRSSFLQEGADAGDRAIGRVAEFNARSGSRQPSAM